MNVSHRYRKGLKTTLIRRNADMSSQVNLKFSKGKCCLWLWTERKRQTVNHSGSKEGVKIWGLKTILQDCCYINIYLQRLHLCSSLAGLFFNMKYVRDVWLVSLLQPWNKVFKVAMLDYSNAPCKGIFRSNGASLAAKLWSRIHTGALDVPLQCSVPHSSSGQRLIRG